MTPGRPYRLSYTGLIIARIAAMRQRTLAEGRLPQFVAAWQRIELMLSTDPLGWGEGCFTLKKSGITLGNGFVPPYAVRFGVLESSKIVFITNVDERPTSP